MFDMVKKLKFKIKSDKISDFIDKLEDLTKIEDSIKLKIDSDNILMYSILGGNIMLAFKNYLVDTNDYFEGNEFDFTLDVIIGNAKKFVKNLNFLKESPNVSIEFTYKESQDDDSIMNARSIQVVGGKLKVNWLAAEHYEVRDINKDSLKNNLNIKNRKWYFNIDKQDFSDVKKLSNINSDRIINISIVSGKVIFSEKSAWELDIDAIEEERNENLILNKKFLSCINDEKNIQFSIFENFMLVKDDCSNLMLSFEQSFEDD
jgi:hypothetical protein